LPADVDHTELTDSNGKVLPVTTDRNDQFVLYDLKGYSPGVYFVHVFSPYHKRVLKVVKL
jgi:hypothetical protein